MSKLKNKCLNVHLFIILSGRHRKSMRLVLCVFLLVFSCQTSATTKNEITALSDLYYATDGDNWRNNTNWLVGDPCASSASAWYGVYCESGHVFGLYLADNELYGSLTESMINLYNLDTISLENNDLFNSIPSNWNQFRALVKIDMKGNSLSGPIPDSLGDLLDFNLNYLDLSDNSLDGVLPSFFNGAESQFEFIDLSNNDFICPIPASATYTRATCIEITMKGAEPMCVDNFVPFLIYGDNFNTLSNVTCIFYDEVTGGQFTATATVVSGTFVQCLAYHEFSACDGSVGNRLYETGYISLSSNGNIISGNSSIKIGILNPYCSPGTRLIDGIQYYIPPESVTRGICSNTLNPTPFLCSPSVTVSSSTPKYIFAELNRDCTSDSTHNCIWLTAYANNIADICPLYQCYNKSTCMKGYYCYEHSNYDNICYSSSDGCSDNC